MYQDGLLIFKGKIIIPKALQENMIKNAHLGHQGMTRTNELLKLHAWFQQMKTKVEQLISKCVCQCVSSKLKREPIIMSEMPAGPWTEIAIDYKGPLRTGGYLVVLVDKYSRYPIVNEVKSTTAKELIKFLDEIFSLFGLVKKIDSDNGTPFTSDEFSSYCKQRNILHHLVTPLWPNANGMVEKFNQKRHLERTLS